MSNNETVQFAKPEDVPELVAMGYKAYHTNEFGADAPDMDKTILTITDIVINGAPLVYRNEDRIIGCFLIQNDTANWWTNKTFLHGLFLYVDPAHRKGSIAKKLLLAGKEYAEHTGQKLVFGMMGSDETIKRKEKLVERLGFKKVETCYELGGK